MTYASDDDIEALVRLVIMAILILTVVVTIVALSIASEGFRIARRHWGTTRGLWLLASTAALALLIGVAGLIASVAPDAALWLGSVAFGVWAVVIVAIDISAGADLLGAGDDILAPWKPLKRAA